MPRRASRLIPQKSESRPMPSWLPTLGTMGDLVPVAGRLKALGALPPFAGDKADVIGLTVRVHPPCLPPLLITGVDYVQHVPKVKAEGLAQEAAVLGLVIVKQGPGGQRATSQSMRTPATLRPSSEVQGQRSTAKHS